MNSTLLDLPALPTLVSVADRSSMVSATWYLHQLWLMPSLQGGFAHAGSSGNVVAGGGGVGNTVVALKVSGARSVPGSWNGSPSPLSSGAAQISVSPQRSGPAFFAHSGSGTPQTRSGAGQVSVHLPPAPGGQTEQLLSN